MAQASMMSMKAAWNLVAIEERFELLTQAKAEGVLAGGLALLLVGAIAYGFDQVSMMFTAALAAFVVAPVYTSMSWRKLRPQAMLVYLAAHTMAQRFAYGFRFFDNTPLLIFKGVLELDPPEIDVDEEGFGDKLELEQHQPILKDVWICLLRGGVVVLSESPRGAALEYIARLNETMKVERVALDTDPDTQFIVVTGEHGQAKLSSRYRAALYAFERKLAGLKQNYLIVNQKRLERHQA